ncbi:MAG: DNA polymerase III subunit gamma/tau [Bacteroidaceae bacterium]|nr:DNA polymerase III subunit gamma/tau [Bacteroidaceae bacterium]
MSEYIVSARKYRPMTFDSVVGQSAIATTLKNAIRADKLAHAYLFCGPRGVGKTTCARIFAKTINCLSPSQDGEACGQCESCMAFNEGRSMNIHELDAASNNSVDDIRTLIEQVRIPPQIGKYKVFIIDEVHMLSSSAFNAFLKTLEEPPAHAIFILATTEKHKILPTILSRCQIYDFQRMSVADIVGHLTKVAEKEGYTCEPAALNVIAQKADGGMRDALSIFDQVVSYTGGNITYAQTIENLNVLDYEYYFRLVDFMLEKKISESLLLFNEVLEKGFDGGPFISGLASHLRDLLVSRDAQTTKLLEASDDIRQRYAEQAARCKPQWLYRAIRLCNDCDLGYRTSRNKRLQVELTLIEAAQATDDEPGAGRRPAHRILKPIFSLMAAAATKAETGAASQPGQTASTKQKAADKPQATPTETSPSAPQATQLAAQTVPAGQSTPTSRPHKPIKLAKFGPSIGAHLRNSSSTSQAEASQAKAKAQQAEPSILEKEPFTQADFALQWQAFINTLPREETALAQNMRIINPKVEEGSTEANISVDNEDLAAMLGRIKPQLLTFLHKALKNDLITLSITVADREQLPTRAYNKREQLKYFCQQNPALISLGKLFKLELS